MAPTVSERFGGGFQMRIVIALGGNALLRRGEPDVATFG
jgi:hypothetical protein